MPMDHLIREDRQTVDLIVGLWSGPGDQGREWVYGLVLTIDQERAACAFVEVGTSGIEIPRVAIDTAIGIILQQQIIIEVPAAIDARAGKIVKPVAIDITQRGQFSGAAALLDVGVAVGSEIGVRDRGLRCRQCPLQIRRCHQACRS